MYMAFLPIITIVMLFMAAFIGFPSSTYYFVLRGLTFFSSLIGAFVFHETPSQKPLQYVYAILALLFNPFFPVRLGRSLWETVDIIAALLLIYLFYFVLKDSKVSFKSVKTIAIGFGMVLLSVFLVSNGKIVNIAFSGIVGLFFALMMTFATYAMGTHLFNRHPVAGKEPAPIVLVLILVLVFAAGAIYAWKGFFRVLGLI